MPLGAERYNVYIFGVPENIVLLRLPTFFGMCIMSACVTYHLCECVCVGWKLDESLRRLRFKCYTYLAKLFCTGSDIAEEKEVWTPDSIGVKSYRMIGVNVISANVWIQQEYASYNGLEHSFLLDWTLLGCTLTLDAWSTLQFYALLALSTAPKGRWTIQERKSGSRLMMSFTQPVVSPAPNIVQKSFAPNSLLSWLKHTFKFVVNNNDSASCGHHYLLCIQNFSDQK